MATGSWFTFRAIGTHPASYCEADAVAAWRLKAEGNGAAMAALSARVSASLGLGPAPDLAYKLSPTSRVLTEVKAEACYLH